MKKIIYPIVLKQATEQEKRVFKFKIETILRKMCAMYKVTDDEIIIKIPKFILVRK